MTREQFIDGYMTRSGFPDYTVDGELVSFDGGEFLALPCHCGDESCEGWAMVPPNLRNSHMQLYGKVRADTHPQRRSPGVG